MFWMRSRRRGSCSLAIRESRTSSCTRRLHERVLNRCSAYLCATREAGRKASVPLMIPPVGALQALAPEHVIYAGTVSKTLAPGLRLGWLVLPDRLTEAVATAKARSDAHTSSFEQLTLAEFITSGAYDRHVRRVRLAYWRRRDRLVAALAAHAPGVRVTGIAAGLHAVAELGPGQREEQVIARAAARGVAIEGLAGYALREHTRGPALVIGYATPPEHGYTTALAFFGHSTAETNVDLEALIASAESFAGAGILVPSRNNILLRWCLANGLRVVQLMTLMSTGLYNDPAGAWLPSISF